ncbi:XRE family transcriptional regulator [Brevibacillus ruminantium]|uniref:XRE family transcriptional regulator n=1 Tax=Brevibacillus ruminantium TaxID=2950604 RepID=A0ABY4WPJ3_9BACL|nr:XRE family transcriptional regulator [Brevibacillus ruminantium]USG66566.1 XRE family transcriptional regulator [Brevibacillus ruminantium]
MEGIIGKQIKALRLQKKMTLKQISEKTNLSISFLSQVERSQSSITLTSLKKISNALGVNPSYFFSEGEEDSKPSIIRRGYGKEVQINRSQFIIQNLSGKLSNPVFEPVLATLMPGDKKVASYSHIGQEFIYVLEGTLTVLLQEEEYDLLPGDSMHIDSNTPHNWYNRSKSPVKLLCVSAPPMYAGE